MRRILHIVLCCMFLCYTSFVAAQSVRTCCTEIDCPITQCVANGCAVVPGAIALPHIAGLIVPPLPRAFPDEIDVSLPIVDKRIWTPPD
jgi:hypothetical protein